jgi:subtilisin-like proprotein convertase family protein
MKKLVIFLLFTFLVNNFYAQNKNYWSIHKESGSRMDLDKSVLRESFPKEFKLFDLNLFSMRENLFSIIENKATKNKTIITLPNIKGQIEEFEVFEASNFESDLQAQFPEIRAFSGKGITDKYATLKLSISPEGIQTIVFRTDRENEFIEAYSKDHTVYAVFNSQRDKSKLNWSCSTEDRNLVNDLNLKVSNFNKSSDGKLRTMRLAQSCTAEYSNFFGATSAAQVNLVLAAFNNTLTRCNGVYEKDLALHLNLISESTNVIFYDPASDPYSPTPDPWNTELQNTLSSSLTGVGTSLAANNAAYDIGHLFGASGGGGSAGCIGCVCVDDTSSLTDTRKGSGYTSPSTGNPPSGDFFDIDYVVHEVGHQLGATHTFSHNNEARGTNVEVGSGWTIMGYAGITRYDVAAHSIDSFHAVSISQIQNNLVTKTCPVSTSISENNATPIVSTLKSYNIPKSTPFVLSGSATDANPDDVLTYSWEQMDDGDNKLSAESNASITKVIGPNFVSFSPTASPNRYFPKLSSVIANSNTTSNVDGDTGILLEALSSVSRDFKFRLTVRDNAVYSSVPPVKVGQTAFTDTKITVNAGAGPFLLTSPNTVLSWEAGTNQNVTWDVAGTTSNGVNTSFVDIFLSTDGGQTYPIKLASKVPNDGSETITVPNNVGSLNRIMVKGFENVFFDISNSNFTIAAPSSTFALSAKDEQSKFICSEASASFTFDYATIGGFTGTTTFSATGIPTGSSTTFSPNTISTANETVTMTINDLSTAPTGVYNIVVTGTSGSIVKTISFNLYVKFSNVILVSPADNESPINTNFKLIWNASENATSYDIQVATDSEFKNILFSGNSNTNSYNLNGLSDLTNYFWRVLPKNFGCAGDYSTPFKFTTGVLNCTTTASTIVPLNIPNTPSNSPVVSNLNITTGNKIGDVNITMNISHTYIADLSAYLTSPSGTQIKLFGNPCNTGATINDINATFDDSGVVTVCANNPGVSGTVLPLQSLSVFNGENPVGIWKLSVYDLFDQDGGKINSWSLNVCNLDKTPLSLVDNQFQDFSLSPVPNDGNFNIKLSSLTNENIKINVSDVQGRQVYEKSFFNTGAFNQYISLDKIQTGIYFVNVTDGIKKTVRRIIVE